MTGLMKGHILPIVLAVCAVNAFEIWPFFDTETTSQEPDEGDHFWPIWPFFDTETTSQEPEDRDHFWPIWPFFDTETTSQEPENGDQCYDSVLGYVFATTCAVEFSVEPGTCRIRWRGFYTANNGTGASTVCMDREDSINIVCRSDRCTDDRDALVQAVRDGLNVHINTDYGTSEKCKQEIIATLPGSITPSEGSRIPLTTTTENPPAPKCILGDESYAFGFIWDASHATYEESGNSSLETQAFFTNKVINTFGDDAQFHISAIGGQTKEGNCRYRSETANTLKDARHVVNETVKYYSERFGSIDYESPIPACGVNPPLRRFLRTRNKRQRVIFNFETDPKRVIYISDVEYDFIKEFEVRQSKDLDELRASGVIVITISTSPFPVNQNSDKYFAIHELNLKTVTEKFVVDVLSADCDYVPAQFKNMKKFT